MKKILLSLILVLGTWHGANAFELNSISAKLATDPLAVDNYTVGVEADAILLEDVNGLGPLGTDIDVNFLSDTSKGGRTEYSVGLFFQPKDWLRLGLSQDRHRDLYGTNTYDIVHRLYFRIGRFNGR
jgi:hypothetical protein